MLDFIKDNWGYLAGFIVFAVATWSAYVQLKAGAERTASAGWKNLSEQLAKQLQEQHAEEARYRVEVEAQFASLRAEIEALKKDGDAKTLENQMLLKRNIALQSENQTLLESKDCCVQDLQRARKETAVIRAQLTNKHIESDGHRLHAEELTRRLHSEGKETRAIT